jgi:hypothetical protein
MPFFPELTKKYQGVVTLGPHPLAGKNHEMTFWTFNTEGVPLPTQRSLREQLRFLYF